MVLDNVMWDPQDSFFAQVDKLISSVGVNKTKEFVVLFFNPFTLSHFIYFLLFNKQIIPLTRRSQMLIEAG